MLIRSATLSLMLAAGVDAADLHQWRYLNPHPDQHGSDIRPARRAIPRSSIPAAVSALARPSVRLGYVIPSNRSAQTDAVAKMRAMMTDNQNWFRDQFDRHGFGPKTFRVETEADGVTPKVYVVTVPDTDADLRVDVWARTISAASAAGLSIWAAGEVWLLVPEAHLQASDGSITGGTALGASFGSGNDPGVAMMGSDSLARWGAGMFTDNRTYHNLTIPDIGPFPLKQGVSFPSFEGTTISSISSAVRGASAHEMAHAFGMPHDFRNDTNTHGNLMGNGLRGFRGNFFPARYPAEHTRLSYVAALALSVSRYFSSDSGDATKPTLTSLTSGAANIAGGRISISFTASDTSGLVAAWLTRSGDLVEEMLLTGTSLTTQFSTAYFTPGETNNYSVAVFDRFGNRRSADTTITPTAGPNRAPRPALKINTPAPLAGQTVVLDASGSSDPDGSASVLKVEWDLNGDGVFDTAPVTTKTRSLPVPFHGNRSIIARLTDPAGATALSTRLALHAHRPPVLIVPGAAPGALELSWLSKIGVIYQPQRSLDMTTWSSGDFAPIRGDGGLLRTTDIPPAGASAAFYRELVTRAAQ